MPVRDKLEEIISDLWVKPEVAQAILDEAAERTLSKQQVLREALEFWATHDCGIDP